MVEHAALAVGPRGLAGERSHPAARTLTLLSREAWQDACNELREALPWTLRRANLLVGGIDLSASVGRRVRAGDAVHFV